MFYGIAITSVVEDGNRVKITGRLEEAINLQDETKWPNNAGKIFSGYVKLITG